MKDISQGLMLRTISRKAYEYLRRNKILPLPAVSTLRRWIKNFRCRSGLQTSVLKIIQQRISAEADPTFGVASVSFDEMHIAKEYQYDQRNDQIIGPFQKMQVVIARGIFANWKQIIFYDFDTPMTAELLKSVISAAEEHRIEVWSISFDLGNHGLVNSLDVTPEKPFFQNPVYLERRIFTFPDPPHLLKLLRNHFLDHGFILSDGTEILRSDLEKILVIDNGELKIHHKLLPIHFTCKNSTRQRVRLAAQLISHTSAAAVRCLLPNKSKLADWLELFDSWFDIMNSRVPCHTKKMACGFGIHFQEQSAVLEKVKQVAGSMRRKNKSSLLPFQTGILISTAAIQGLYNDLKEKFNIKFILTSRLNQDPVENTFSQIRGMGSSHPGPVDSANRLRLLLLGRNAQAVVENPAVAFEQDDSSGSDFDCGTILMKEVTSQILTEEP